MFEISNLKYSTKYRANYHNWNLVCHISLLKHDLHGLECDTLGFAKGMIVRGVFATIFWIDPNRKKKRGKEKIKEPKLQSDIHQYLEK